MAGEQEMTSAHTHTHTHTDRPAVSAGRFESRLRFRFTDAIQLRAIIHFAEISPGRRLAELGKGNAASQPSVTEEEEEDFA